MAVLLLDFVVEVRRMMFGAGADFVERGSFLSRGCLSWCVFCRERERSMSGIMIG